MNKLIICILINLLVLFLYLNVKNTPETFTNETPPFPIDIVYTWAGEKKSSDARLSNNHELKYSLRSIFKFMPWINHVFILTNPPKKVPSWFNDNYKQKITILDHNDTFQEKHLPCTNSNSIETTLCNISELSEHFIYLNDDFFIGRPVPYTIFFTNDGKIIIDKQKIMNCKSMRLPNSYNILNFELPTYCDQSRHIPLPNKKSVINNFNNTYKDYIEWIRNIKTRNGRGFDICKKNNLQSWCQQQHNIIAKYAYDKGECITKTFSDNDIVFIWNHNDNEDKFSQIKKHPPLFFCINDKTFTNASTKDLIYEGVHNFLKDFYKDKPFYEK